MRFLRRVVWFSRSASSPTFVSPIAVVAFAIGAFVVVAFAGCTGSPLPADDGRAPDGGELSGTLELTGSSTLGPLAAEIGRRFEQRHGRVRVNVQTGGSSRGIADVRSGLADIGMSSRELKESERAGRVSWMVARDGVCFIVHADNPVGQLRRQQLRDVFVGAVNNWRELGGPDAAITVVNRAAGRSELDLVTEYFGIDPADIQADLIAGENQQGIKMVSTDVHAITYMSVGASEYAAREAGAIKLLALEGVPASSRTVSSGRYPLARPLSFVTTETPSPLATALIEFARSPEVHDLVRELSYVPLEPADSNRSHE